MAQQQSATEELIDCIIDQELDLGDYNELLPPIIEKHFLCLKKVGGHAGTLNSPHELVDRVIRWENGEQTGSLQITLQNEFDISIKKPYKIKNNKQWES